MSRVECTECGGRVRVLGGVTEPHGVWVQRAYGVTESDRRCPGSARRVPEDQVPPTVSALVLLSRAGARQLRCSPSGFVRTTSGCPVSLKAWQECVDRDLVHVNEDRVVVPTQAGMEWLALLGPAGMPAAPGPASRQPERQGDLVARQQALRDDWMPTRRTPPHDPTDGRFMAGPPGEDS